MICRKILLIFFYFTVGLFSASVLSQEKQILIDQADNRFTVSAKRDFSSFAGSEYYYFYIQNNTADEYNLVVDVTLNLACKGQKKFKLGVNQPINLKPYGNFTPKNDYSHIVTFISSEIKDCVLTDGNSYTLLQSLTYTYSQIEKVTPKVTEQASPTSGVSVQKEGTVSSKVTLEPSISKTTKNSNQNTEKSNTEGIDKSKLPEFFQTTDGKYFHKVGDNIQEVSYDSYMQLKKDKKDLTASKQKEKLSPEQQQQYVDQIMSKIKAEQQAQIDNQLKIQKNTDLQNQAMASSQEVIDVKNKLKTNSKLYGSFRSVDEIMQEYNSKLSNIDNIMQQLSEKRTTQINAMSNQLSYSYNMDAQTAPYSEAAGTAVKLIGGIIASNKEEKERKEALAELERQKKEALESIAEEEKRVLTNLRMDLFKEFKEEVFPNSATKVSTDVIYFFAYGYDAGKIGEKETILYLTNVFEVKRYGDDTWPFKSSYVEKLTKLVPNFKLIHGYYSDYDEANQMVKAMKDIFIKTGGSVKEISFGKKDTKDNTKQNQQNEVDFWETGKKPNSNNKKSPNSNKETKDNFWNN